MSRIKKFLECLNIRFILYFSLAAIMISAGGASISATDTKSWRGTFDTSACTWSSTGKNDYFILEPGYQETLEGREEGAATVLVITVLPDTRKIGNTETRIVEERETKDGQLVEVSRNFFAVCGPSNDVFYFGEDVDMYKNGKIENHEGSWVAETGGAKPGLFMPAKPHLGDRFYQEIAPKVAMDRVEIVSVSESLKTPAGEFHDCVKTEETTPIEPGAKEYKVFAKGVGIVQDGELLLRKYGSTSSK